MPLVSVRAIPAPQFQFRFRAGQAWTREAVTVELSDEQIAQLKGDPQIVVEPAAAPPAAPSKADKKAEK